MQAHCCLCEGGGHKSSNPFSVSVEKICRNHFGKDIVEDYFRGAVKFAPLFDPDLHKLKLKNEFCNDKNIKNEALDENDIEFLEITDPNVEIDSPSWFTKTAEDMLLIPKLVL